MKAKWISRVPGDIRVSAWGIVGRRDRQTRSPSPAEPSASGRVAAAASPSRQSGAVPEVAVAVILGGLATSVISVAVLLLAAAPADARGQSRKHSCVPPHARMYTGREIYSKADAYSVDIENRTGRVYRFGVGGDYYRCLFSDGRGYRLFGKGNRQLARDTIELERLTGHYFGFEIKRNDLGAFGTVSVIDLRTGRTVHRAPTVTGPPVRCADPSDVYMPSANALILRGSGAVAWIGEKSCISSDANKFREVHRFDSGGHVVVDSGSSITPTSLAVQGSTMFWINGGSRRSARIR